MDRSDRGAAAIELALMATLLSALLVLGAPLSLILKEQLKLSRTAGRTARFASSAPDVNRYSCSGVRVARRPSRSEVVAEARCSHFGGAAVPDGFRIAVDPAPDTAAPGAAITITVTNQISLGPIGALLALAGIDDSYSSPTLSATAVSIEE